MTSSDDVSKVLFGSKHRLKLLAVIASAGEDELFGAHLARVIDAPSNQVTGDLGRLAEVGLLSRVRKGQGVYAQYYVRENERFWQLAAQMHDAVNGS